MDTFCHLPSGMWFPPEIKNKRAAEFNFRIEKVVRALFTRPPKISVSDWALQNRTVTDGAHEGAWDHAFAPHTVKVMDSFGKPWVREVWFCGVEQSGKTNTMLNCMAWAVDVSPGNIFYLMPTEETAAKVTGGKIGPMLRRSVALSKYLTGRSDDIGLSKITLANGVTILPAHANSASSMATWAAKYCFGDEVDKYPAMAGKEADPITLIKKRNRIYKGRYKRFFSSTPAGMYIYKGVYGDDKKRGCDQIFNFHVKCPHCQAEQWMSAKNLVVSDHYPDSRYVCASCAVEWDDQAREAAIRAGDWACVKGKEIKKPAKVGYHHRAWECLDITLAEIAEAWQNSELGGIAEKTAWANGYEAIDYEQQPETSDSASILLLKDDRPRGLVPGGGVVSCLSISIDTQAKGFWAEIRAWGYGRELESWQIREGYYQTFEALEKIIYDDRYEDSEGTQYTVSGGFIDSGGTKGEGEVSRTVEVYDWCKKNPKIRPVKGQQTMTGLVSFSKAGNHFNVNTGALKDELRRKLNISPADPGAWHLHSEATADYAKQLVSEYRDERGLWQCPRGRANHFLDVSVYHLAFAEQFGLKYVAPPGAAKPERPPAVHNKPRRW